MSENGEIYTAGKNFTLPPAATAVTNLTSVSLYLFFLSVSFFFFLYHDHHVINSLPGR